MEEKEDKISDILERIFHLIEYKGYNSLRDFAINALGYDNSEKINRYKKSGTAPSIDIILDISRIFDDISLDWLIAGKGDMIRIENVIQGDRNSVGNNQGTISGHNIGDNSININAQTAEKIIHPDRRVEIELSARDSSRVAEPPTEYGNVNSIIAEKDKEIALLKQQIIDLQGELIKHLKSSKD